uniref:Uncharacterized protein n=1 Tax=Rhizophora mucronata TaxID=61149 RepID=A0A2P2JB20_RHIMU
MVDDEQYQFMVFLTMQSQYLFDFCTHPVTTKKTWRNLYCICWSSRMCLWFHN